MLESMRAMAPVGGPMKRSQAVVTGLLSLVLSGMSFAEHGPPQVDVLPSLIVGAGSPPAHEPGQMVIPNPSNPSLPYVEPWPIDYGTGRYQTGDVVILLTVIPGGYPTDPVVEKSSGYLELDTTAQAAVMQWRFHAALKDGKEVPAFVRVPINLHASAPPPGMAQVDGTVSSRGVGAQATSASESRPPSARAQPTPPSGERAGAKVARTLGVVVGFLIETAAGVAEAQANDQGPAVQPRGRAAVQQFQPSHAAPAFQPVVTTDCTASNFGGTHVSCVSR